MKKILAFLVLLIILVGVVIYRIDDIFYLVDNYITPKFTPVSLGDKNQYYREYDFNYVQNTNNFEPHSRQDILNIYYTAINAGKTSFTFYCPSEYTSCLDEVSSLANNQNELSNINNYVHPYNGFSHIETEYDSLGKVTLNIEKNYSEYDIIEIEKKIDEIITHLTSNLLSERENIKSIHDYIINNSKYDSARAEDKVSLYRSDIAYGPLFQGYAICGGYTDLMELFLEKLNIKSYKISSNNHIWNALLLDGTWYHLDLTWDDPVASDGNDYLEYDYFLIDTNRLLSLDVTQHQFDQNVFSELRAF